MNLDVLGINLDVLNTKLDVLNMNKQALTVTLTMMSKESINLNVLGITKYEAFDHPQC